MLYNNFIICIMVCAFMALLNMIDNQEWGYIILPIGILIWGCFKFFDENDRKYLWSRGINPDECDMFFPELYEGTYPINHNTESHNVKGNTITWYNQDKLNVEDNFDPNLWGSSYNRHASKETHTTWQDTRYKGIAKKCKRNFKISIGDGN